MPETGNTMKTKTGLSLSKLVKENIRGSELGE